MVKILFLNALGGGFPEEQHIPEGTTVLQLFQQKNPGESAANYRIAVNRDVAVAGYVLQDGDRVTITPTKVAAA